MRHCPSNSYRRTFEHVFHLIEGLVGASGEDFHARLQIANLGPSVLAREEHSRANLLLFSEAELTLGDAVLVASCCLRASR